MKTALRTIAVAGLLVLLAVLSFGQQPQMTAITTIAGDAVTATRSRGAMEYLPSGVIWLASSDYPYTGKNWMYLSTDHGATWAKKSVYTNATLSTPGITGVAARDANLCILCTTTGEILRTTNGGAKWDTVGGYTGDLAFCDGVRFVVGDTMFAYGDADDKGVYVARSFDAGKTWSRIPNVNSSLPGDSLNTGGIYESQASAAQGSEVFGRTIWLTLDNTLGDPGSILKSTDAGSTWSWFRIALPGGASVNNYLRSITFKDANVGFGVCRQAYGTASVNGYYLLKTTDGGRTWSDTISVEPGKGHLEAKPWTARAIRGTNTVVAVGFGTVGAKSWISNDNGTTWAPIATPTPSTSADLRNIVFGSATQGISIGYYAMVKYSAANTVNVTFWANTATVPDTLKASSFVQIRGSASLFGPWGLSSKAIMQNVAGDYWKGTFALNPGDTIQYKFFTNANSTVGSAIEHQGWENNTTDGSGNRILIVPAKDTVLPLQFVNGTPSNQAQFFKPYVNQNDSIEVWFRVNMAGNESFNKATQFMGVRGGTAPLEWGKSIVLTRESQHGNGGSQQYDGTNFWSGYARFPKSAFANDIEYKYVILKTNSPSADVIAWEDGIRAAPDVAAGGNRLILKSPGISDTTIYWKWWANAPATGFKGADTVIVTFRANMSRAVSERGFTFSDTLQVRSGYGATAKEVRTKTMTRSGITGSIFTATDTVIASVGKSLNYQYYVVKSGNDVREAFYDYDWAGDVSQAERRKVTVSKSTTVNDTTTTNTDMRRMPKFRNTTKVSKAFTVLITVDLRPAYTQVARGDTLTDIQGSLHVTKNSNIKTMGVAINGPMVNGWASWGAGLVASTDTLHKMWDDGTHGDAVANDTIYSIRHAFGTDDFIGNEFKFGIGGGDNEGGKGGFGNNHIENVDDSQTTFVLANDFGSINPKFYNTWDFNLHKPKATTAVEEYWNGVPLVYALDQNYPNPFNPSTTIRFNLPTDEIVALKIFNALGQEVMTLLNEKMSAGNHTVRFDAAKLTTGVYFYQINAGKFVETKKMTLIK